MGNIKESNDLELFFGVILLIKWVEIETLFKIYHQQVHLFKYKYILSNIGYVND